MKTTNGCLADTPSNASCIAWAGRHIATNLPSKGPHSLRCGQATLTGPQRTWIYSDKDHPLSAMSNKQSEESARFRKKTALYSIGHRSKAPKSKKMTSTDLNTRG